MPFPVPPVLVVGPSPPCLTFAIKNELHQVCQVPAREAGSGGLHLLDQGSAVCPEAAQALLL